MNRTKNSMRNMFYGIIAKFISLALPFFVRTALIYKIGIEYAGLNSLFTSILNFLSLTELGFGSAMVFMLYKPIDENNYPQICKVLNFLKKTYRIIGCAILGIGVCLLPFLDKLVSGECPDDINLQLLFVIYLLNTAVSYLLFAYKSILFNAYQRVDITNRIISIVTTVGGIVKIAIIFMTSNYYIYAIFLPVSVIVQNLIIGYVAHKKYPFLKPEGKLEKHEVIDIKNKVLALAGHKVGGTIVGTLDSVVISTLLGLTVLAKYSNYFMIITSLMGIINIFMTSTLSSVGNYLLNHTTEQKESLFLKLNFGMIWIVGWCSVCLLCLYQPFVTIWLGHELLLPFTSVICFSLYFYSWQFRVLLVNFKDAAGLWTQDVLKPYVASAVNIILNIYLIKRIGLNGANISTIICMFFIFFPWETQVLYTKLFKKSPIKFYVREMLYLLSWCLIAICTYLVCDFIAFSNTILILFVRGLICLVVPNILFLLLHHKSSYFMYYKGLLKKILKKEI